MFNLVKSKYTRKELCRILFTEANSLFATADDLLTFMLTHRELRKLKVSPLQVFLLRTLFFGVTGLYWLWCIAKSVPVIALGYHKRKL